MPMHLDTIASSGPAVADPLAGELERHRRALTGYCYRMLGSGSEAEDAVQETFVKAWRKADGLQEPAALKSWLYRIATNTCLDMLDGAQRRARPMDLGGAGSADADLAPPLPETAWVQPFPTAGLLPEEGDPAELAQARETVRLAFIAALQHLPPRQRAVLILREVLRWQATEVAELLDTTVASVNSALQRARATLDQLGLDSADGTADPLSPEHQELFQRYVDAFERYDVEALVALLAEDAEFSMPPWNLWLRGPDQVRRWLKGKGAGCEGSRLVRTTANGFPAYAQYKPAGDGTGDRVGWAITVLESDGRQITGVHQYIGAEQFPLFGLPERIPA